VSKILGPVQISDDLFGLNLIKELVLVVVLLTPYSFIMEYNYKIQKYNNRRETLQEKTCITSA